MLRRGFIKQEFLFVILVIAILAGCAIFLTMRDGASKSDSFVRGELLGRPPVAPPAATEPESPSSNAQDIPKEKQETITTDSGLKYIDLSIGSGEKVKLGSTVSVIYTGKLKTGEQFDSNVGKNPLTFQVGIGRVIKGWDEGLVGMQKGSKRKLIIPFHLAYGEKGNPPKIPPRAELTFDVEVVGITNR